MRQIVSDCQRSLWPFPCSQHPGRGTGEGVLMCSFRTLSLTQAASPHSDPTSFCPDLETESSCEWESCAGCWGLIAVRNHLCIWMLSARSRESRVQRVTETISFMETKDPKRVRNMCWEREWGQTGGNSGCIWAALLRCAPGSNLTDIK